MIAMICVVLLLGAGCYRLSEEAEKKRKEASKSVVGKLGRASRKGTVRLGIVC